MWLDRFHAACHFLAPPPTDSHRQRALSLSMGNKCRVQAVVLDVAALFCSGIPTYDCQESMDLRNQTWERRTPAYDPPGLRGGL
jgi:hypothetical protein